jgi:hypothetical protein
MGGWRSGRWHVCVCPPLYSTELHGIYSREYWQLDYPTGEYSGCTPRDTTTSLRIDYIRRRAETAEKRLGNCHICIYVYLA